MTHRICNPWRASIIVLSTWMLGLMSGTVSYAAAKLGVADQLASSGGVNDSKESILQTTYDGIGIKFNDVKTDLTLSYVSEDKNYDALSYYYQLLGRNGCTIDIEDNVNASHIEKYIDTEMTKSYQNDVYKNIVNINMSRIKSISITHPGKDAPYPTIFSYNPDILNNCVNINFKATDNGHAFRITQYNHIHQYLNSEHHENNEYKMEVIPKEISASLTTYSVCLSNEELAERLVRHFNDYREACKEQRNELTSGFDGALQ